VTAAFRKAQSLHRHAAYMGVKPQEFQVALTKEEAFELLDVTLEEQGQFMTNPELFARDIQVAKSVQDPWPLLENWALLGMALVPLH
jgi:hypothetical protein